MWNPYIHLDAAANLKIFFHILDGTFPHLYYLQFPSLTAPPVWSFSTTNLDKLEVSFNLLIRCCCDSGYPWTMKIDWLLWCICENPNSPVSTGDVMTLKPGAGATGCIWEAHCNSSHTLQLVNMAQYDPLVFLNSIKLNSLRSHVSNSDSSHFNHLIVPAPFIEDFGSSIYENNGPSSVQNFEMEQWGLGVNLNLHLHMHVLLWTFDDFPQLLLHPYRNWENKNIS